MLLKSAAQVLVTLDLCISLATLMESPLGFGFSPQLMPKQSFAPRLSPVHSVSPRGKRFRGTLAQSLAS